MAKPTLVRETSSENLAARYAPLCQIARRQLGQDRSRHEFQPSELVHEAYLRMVTSNAPSCKRPRRLQGIASRIIRNTLVDEARKRRTQKRGGDVDIVFDAEIRPVSRPENPEDRLAVREVLGRLRKLNPRMGQIVYLRFFEGLTAGETATALGISISTVKCDWKMAREWLRGHLAASFKPNSR